MTNLWKSVWRVRLSREFHSHKQRAVTLQPRRTVGGQFDAVLGQHVGQCLAGGAHAG